MPGIDCLTCGDLRYSPSFEWVGTEDAQRRGTFSIAPTPAELQQSALQGCGSCDLLIRSVAVFQDVSTLATTTSYGSPCRISARSKYGTALCVGWTTEGNTGKASSIELFVDEGVDQVPTDFAIGTARGIRPTLDCKETASFIEKCLNACTIKHNDCTRKISGFSPKRLLHVGCKHGTGFSDPYLVDGLNYQVLYVALSYCWGKTDFRRMTRLTLEQDQGGIDMKILPRTFQDAISVLRALGICYIWIDALCIMQDDRDDWKIEGAKMDQVYTHALFVLCITFGNDAHSGFLSHHPSPTEPNSLILQARDAKRASYTESCLYSFEGRKMSIRVRVKLRHDAIVSQLLTIINSDPTMPVLSRAWCLQERLLAARTVHFTPKEMIWECSGATWCECQGSELDAFAQEFHYMGCSSANSSTPLSSYKALFRRQFTDKWYLTNLWQHTVSAYTWRDLTYQSDRLPALSGLAALFQTAKMGTYLAGLWHDKLAYYLHWRSARCDRYVKRTSQPSWSWASTDGPIAWESDCSELDAAVTIVGADVEPKGSIGQITSGTIKLSGRVVKAKVMLEWFDAGLRPDESFAALCLEGKEIPFILDVAQYPPNNALRQKPGVVESQLSDGENVTCLMVLTRSPQGFPYTLVLRQSLYVPGAYERVDLSDSNVLSDVYRNAKEETLKLV